MIRVRQVEVKIDYSISDIRSSVAKKIKINSNEILDLKINKKSLDARHDRLKYIFEVDISLKDESKIKLNEDVIITPDDAYKYEITGIKKQEKPIIVVGSGPSGLFTTYMLSKEGYKVIMIERGEKVEDRVKRVEDFWKNNKLNTNSNVQFGEGGAGTFSDGKLNTLKKDKENRQKEVFRIFVSNGAPEEILYDSKPHIGTDILRDVIKNMRNTIISNGGMIRYNACLTDIKIENNKIKSITVNDSEEIETDDLVLAIGHSARDTFKMLHDKGIYMEPKPFALGIRIQHPQKMINNAQYNGEFNLPPASYKLTYHSSNNRGVYSFCMCPGGFVVNASSEKNRLAINGMSNYKRDEENANSALIVTVSPKDYGNSPLDGIEFQRVLEEKAYNIGKGLIPIQTYKAFRENKILSLGSVKPVMKGNYTLANINEVFPEYITDALKEAIEYFGGKIKGFNSDDAIIAAVESRTSSPVRIVRDETFNSNIDGIYPIGEGAGYAGGITTSAMDGLKLFELIIKKYRS